MIGCGGQWGPRVIVSSHVHCCCLFVLCEPCRQAAVVYIIQTYANDMLWFALHWLIHPLRSPPYTHTYGLAEHPHYLFFSLAHSSSLPFFQIHIQCPHWLDITHTFQSHHTHQNIYVCLLSHVHYAWPSHTAKGHIQLLLVLTRATAECRKAFAAPKN